MNQILLEIANDLFGKKQLNFNSPKKKFVPIPYMMKFEINSHKGNVISKDVFLRIIYNNIKYLCILEENKSFHHISKNKVKINGVL